MFRRRGEPALHFPRLLKNRLRGLFAIATLLRIIVTFFIVLFRSPTSLTLFGLYYSFSLYRVAITHGLVRELGIQVPFAVVFPVRLSSKSILFPQRDLRQRLDRDHLAIGLQASYIGKVFLLVAQAVSRLDIANRIIQTLMSTRVRRP